MSWDSIKSAGLFVLCVALISGLTVLSIRLTPDTFWLIVKIYSVVSWVEILSMAASIFLIFPSLLRTTRPLAATGYIIFSYIFALSLWMYGFIWAYNFSGVAGVLVGMALVGVGVVPVAMLDALFQGQWHVFANLAIGIFLTFGSGTLGAFLTTKANRERSLVLPG